jgi:hypothetical protein
MTRQLLQIFAFFPKINHVVFDILSAGRVSDVDTMAIDELLGRSETMELEIEDGPLFRCAME